MSDQSPLLDGPISQEIAGLIGALMPIGGIVGGIGFGLIANWIGYKRVLHMASIPMIVIVNYIKTYIN